MSLLVRRPPALMFGVPISNLTMDDTVDEIGELVDHGRRTKSVHQIATVNVDFLVNAIADPELRSVLQRATLCLADGTPIVWTGSLLDVPLPERVAGSDLVPRLVAESERTGWKIHVFGSAPEVASKAYEMLKARHPNASLTIDPGPRLADPRHVDSEVIESIRAVDADILLVALGNPKQEWFIDAHKNQLGTPVMMGIGGSLDMLVGARQRAPLWAQKWGLEWVVRAVQEPRRLVPRYARDIRIFLPALARELRSHRRSRNGARLHLTCGPDAITATITGTITGKITATTTGTTTGMTTGGAPAEAETWSDAAVRIRAGLPLNISVESSSERLRGETLAALVGLTQLAQTHSSVTWNTMPEIVANWCAVGGIPPAMLSLPMAD